MQPNESEDVVEVVQWRPPWALLAFLRLEVIQHSVVNAAYPCAAGRSLPRLRLEAACAFGEPECLAHLLFVKHHRSRPPHGSCDSNHPTGSVVPASEQRRLELLLLALPRLLARAHALDGDSLDPSVAATARRGRHARRVSAARASALPWPAWRWWGSGGSDARLARTAPPITLAALNLVDGLTLVPLSGAPGGSCRLAADAARLYADVTEALRSLDSLDSLDSLGSRGLASLAHAATFGHVAEALVFTPSLAAVLPRPLLEAFLRTYDQCFAFSDRRDHRFTLECAANDAALGCNPLNQLPLAVNLARRSLATSPETVAAAHGRASYGWSYAASTWIALAAATATGALLLHRRQ